MSGLSFRESDVVICLECRKIWVRPFETDIAMIHAVKNPTHHMRYATRLDDGTFKEEDVFG